MAKYIIDLDAFVQCLEFTSEGKINGHEYAYLQNVHALVARFPKYAVEETISIEMKNDIKISE